MEGLEKFAKQLPPLSSGPYFFGEKYTLVDIVLTPWALNMPVLKTLKDVDIPTSGGENDVWTRFKQWSDAVVSRDSVRRTSSDPERYLQHYARFAEHTTSSEISKAMKEGKKPLL